MRRRSGCLVLATAVLGAAARLHSQCPPLAPSAGQAIPCRYDATLTRLFTPRAAPDGTYRVYVTDVPLEKVAARLREHSQGQGQSDAWTVQRLEALEAFSSGGPYDQTDVSRLYRGKRARVARGPVFTNGRVTASVWLIAPYPDPSLSRLEPGTLIIEFRVPPDAFERR